MECANVQPATKISTGQSSKNIHALITTILRSCYFWHCNRADLYLLLAVHVTNDIYHCYEMGHSVSYLYECK